MQLVKSGEGPAVMDERDHVTMMSLFDLLSEAEDDIIYKAAKNDDFGLFCCFLGGEGFLQFACTYFKCNELRIS